MVNVFSFCLYGPRNPRYYAPLLENIQIIAQYFPDWKAYIYTGSDVDAGYLGALRTYSNVVIHETGLVGSKNMIHRFFAIDEPEVDLMMVRDADSLIHWRDRWAIHRFLEKPEFVAHMIRDHRCHATRIMGGLWGLRKSAGLSMRQEYDQYSKNPLDLGVAHDQNFLGVQIYPKISYRMWVHYSEGSLDHVTATGEYQMCATRILDGEQGELFPFKWTETMYCGRVDGALVSTSSKPLGFLATTRVR